MEIDLYKFENNRAKSVFDPTGMYFSARYSLSRNIQISGSYDARKNVMYYETYKSYSDTLFERELRQGFRLQLNYRILKNLSLGLQSGYRFLKSDPNPSKNIYGYLTYSNIPVLNITATVFSTLLESGYINGKNYGFSVYRDLMSGKLQSGAGYRYVDYKLPESLLNINQHIAEFNLSWQFMKKMSLGINYEGTFETTNHYNRIYFQLRKRF
jgi:hypothetical protein